MKLNYKHDEKKEKFLKKKGITEQVEFQLGFNPKEQKWYGWSHRAIYGFGIGSKVKQGDAGYSPSNESEFLSDLRRHNKSFNECHKHTYKVVKGGVSVTSEFMGDKGDKSQDKFIGDTSVSIRPYPKKWGKGSWTAKTLADAKQMAINFAESVS